MQRVLIAGISGAGKTTLARTLAERLGLPFHELDALYHGPGWTPRESFESDVAAIVAGDRWVIDSLGYPVVRDLVWGRADTAVWLDYSRAVTTTRVVQRSFDRAWHRRELFNGNTEGFRDWLDPDHPIRWGWANFARRRRELDARSRDPAWSHVPIVRLTSPRHARHWLDAVTAAP